MTSNHTSRPTPLRARSDSSGMRLSEQFAVPAELALLYDFVNSLDRRRYLEAGVAHAGGDELKTLPEFRNWLAARDLASRVNGDAHRRALALREAIRAFLKVPPDARGRNPKTARRLAEAARAFPLVLRPDANGSMSLQQCDASDGLGQVLAQLYRLSAVGTLGRLKMCASGECGWIFFDRSKPGNRRWCSSRLCGNRQKTRAYRERHRA